MQHRTAVQPSLTVGAPLLRRIVFCHKIHSMTGWILTSEPSPATNQHRHPTSAISGPAEDVDWRAITGGIADGDRECFRVYYEHFFGLMYDHVQRLSGRDEATCLDLVHDAMLKAIRCMKSFDDKAQITSWTVAVVKSTVYDWLRKQSREKQFVAEMNIGDGNTSAAPAVILTDVERMDWVQHQLQQLPPELRKLVRLRYRMGWTLDRIAKHVGLTTGAVDGRIGRSICKLKERASREFEENE